MGPRILIVTTRRVQGLPAGRKERSDRMLGELYRNAEPSHPTPEAELERALDPARLPRHVAVIMDGNGRWAKRRGLPRFAGHQAGIESLRELTRNCAELGIKVLTVYAFSTENWARPADEVRFLLKLLDEVLEREVERLHANGVRVQVIGRRDALSADLVAKIEQAEALTRENQTLTLNVGFNYGGRAEIVDAARRLVELARRGEIAPEDVDESLLAGLMYTRDLPDPDLLIRTGGDARISNFLLWQVAYAEIWLTPVCWPDFRRIHLLEALVDYQRRERRFGRL